MIKALAFVVVLYASLVVGDGVSAITSGNNSSLGNLRHFPEKGGRAEIYAVRVSEYPQAEAYYLCDIFRFDVSGRLFAKVGLSAKHLEFELPKDGRQGEADWQGERVQWVKMPFLIKQGRCRQERKEGELDCSLETTLLKTEIGYELDCAFVLSENLGNGVTNLRCSVASQQTLQPGQLIPVGGICKSEKAEGD